MPDANQKQIDDAATQIEKAQKQLELAKTRLKDRKMTDQRDLENIVKSTSAVLDINGVC